MSGYRDQVAAALRAVTIRGPARYVWLGHASRALPAPLDSVLDDGARRSYLVSTLREELYASFFCPGRPVSARGGRSEPAADPWLTAAMAQANTGSGGWEPGWTIERLDRGEAVVRTARLRMRVPVGDCRVGAGAMRPGGAVSVRMPGELPMRSPGFLTIVSEAPADLAAVESVVRVYWSITRGSAAALVGALTAPLNAARAPFRLKVADHPFRLDRCDAAVLYLPGSSFTALRGMLADIAGTLAAHLSPRVPAFTLELAPGVGLAEADRSGESFGVRRCSALADAIVRAHDAGTTRIDERVDAVVARFAEDGVLIDAPYREPALAGRHVL
jgi:hypothetical protein